MAVIVGVHGIAQQYRGGMQLGSVWFDALRDGLIAAGHRATADALRSDDLRVAFFGDLFRPVGTMAESDAPYTAADIARGPERELLAELYRAAVRLDPSAGPADGALGPVRVGVQVMLERLLQSATFAGVARRALVGSLKQVTRFLADRAVKERVLARVAAEVGEDTRVLIGHSLGSVVAYEYLCRYRSRSVRMLVTVGSPLGIPRLVFDQLTPTPVNGRGAWPGEVSDWVNVADPDDVIALRKRLGELFVPEMTVELGPVLDRLVDNGGRPHAVDRYLNAAAVGEGLGHVLA